MLITKIKPLEQYIKNRFNTVIIISFGATHALMRAIREYACFSTAIKTVFINNIDMETVSNYTKIMRDSCILIISISGNTAETKLYAQIAHDAGYTSNLFIITNGKSILHNIAIQYNATYIDIASTSRFSVFNNATYLLGSILNSDITQLTRDTLKTVRTITPIKKENICFIAPHKFLGLIRWFIYLWNEHIGTTEIMCTDSSDVIHGNIERLQHEKYKLFIIEDNHNITGMPSAASSVLRKQKEAMYTIIHEISKNTEILRSPSFATVAGLCMASLAAHITKIANMATLGCKKIMLQTTMLSSETRG